MLKMKTIATALGGTALLAACSGGPQFDSIATKLTHAGPAKSAVAAAHASAVPGDAYHAALRDAYLGYADFELTNMQDYTDAIFHANRAMAVAGGQDVQPQAIGDRKLASADQPMLSAARDRLTKALAAGGATVAPMPAARALASFDCWMEQQEENFQPDDIAACKETFEAAMDELDAAMAPKPALPAVVTIDAGVLFDFDKSVVKPEFAGELDKVAEVIKANPGKQLEIQGHTDSKGSDKYNQGLSERRAQAVVTYLAGRGVAADRMTAVGYGEKSPVASNDTSEGRAKNRRVEIHTQ